MDHIPVGPPIDDHSPKVCIWVEHAFAALKGHFQSLRELRLVMRTQENVKIRMHWIQCCIILHNMIIQFKEVLGIEKAMGWARREGMEPYHLAAPVVVDVPDGTPGQAFHADLMTCLFTHLEQV